MAKNLKGIKAMLRSLSAEDRKKVMEAKHGIAGTPKMLTQMKYGDMSMPMQIRMKGGEGNVPMTSAAYGKMEKAMYGKSKKGMGRYGVSMQTPGKKK